jgi:hypothetical protein
MTAGWSTGTGGPAPQPLVIVVPHRLGRQEAKRRLDAGIARLRPELGAFVSALNYGWQADTLNFNAQPMWLTIGGRIVVQDDTVRIEIDLPWLMRLLGDTIQKQVSERATLMLEKPPGRA